MNPRLTLTVERSLCSLRYVDADHSIDAICAFDPASLAANELISDPPLPQELTNAIGSITDELDDELRAVPDLGPDTEFVATGSLVFTAAAVEVGSRAVTDWPSSVFSKDQLEEVFRTLATEPRSDRRRNPGLPADEVDVIVAALCVLVSFVRRLSIARLTIS
jgi:exopolyphosphatase / guanosine-5'-triphosphate,3'-diphosphate pyrophosphatase